MVHVVDQFLSGTSIRYLWITVPVRSLDGQNPQRLSSEDRNRSGNQGDERGSNFQKSSESSTPDNFSISLVPGLIGNVPSENTLEKELSFICVSGEQHYIGTMALSLGRLTMGP